MLQKRKRLDLYLNHMKKIMFIHAIASILKPRKHKMFMFFVTIGDKREKLLHEIPLRGKVVRTGKIVIPAFAFQLID